ncbi:MAG: aspartate/glutamate racemase family protein [Anaerolineaceae bacterium]|nr:aspartate/glutamate racemase family protein [Anaerolineaceae bacterium]MBN2676683.1 aspartate/glutamate racemase family protein [Anaerolineaceae bacterium]
MKTIGLIGGMSWESTQEYYRIINEETKRILGGFHSAKCVLYSVDFAEIEKLQHEDRWEELTGIMIHAAQSLENAGAEFILICTNTMHKMADEVQNSIHVPLLHLVDTTGEQIRKAGLKKVGLLGTKFTMEQDFYKGRLSDMFGLEVLIPDFEEREIIHHVIYQELCLGKINQASKEKFIRIITNLINNGAEGIILGCTEIPLLVKQKDIPVSIYDTTEIHARSAVNYALG